MKKPQSSSILCNRQFFSICLLFVIHNFQCFGQASEKVFIADSLMKYPTIEHMIDLPYFENKVVLVDLWYTSCPPCIKEFQFNPALKNRYQDQEVAFLYICVPNSAKWKDNEKTWIELIKKHNLAGVHIKVTNPSC